MNLNNLKNEISNTLPEDPVFIYFAVGTVAGLRNTEGLLEPANYHQFPPFLQDLHNKIPNLHLFIVLVDPMQETPPYMARDFDLTSYIGSASTATRHYTNQANNLQVFVHKQNVTMQSYIDENDNMDGLIDITETLRDLNKFAIEHHASLLYHDFTGRRTASVAEYFDNEIENKYLDQIVYAMSAREDHGCYFDLTQLNAYFATRIEALRQRPIIKMFNMYQFILNDSFHFIQAEREKYSEEMQLYIDVQQNQIVNDICVQFKNVHIAMLRQVRKLMLSPPEEAAEIDPNKYLYNSFSPAHKKMCLDLLENKDYALLWDLLYNYCADKLHLYTTLAGINMTGEEMLFYMTGDPDPYKWYQSVKLYM
jgi:hypothetical protein